jgi:hypothetical protein
LKSIVSIVVVGDDDDELHERDDQRGETTMREMTMRGNDMTNELREEEEEEEEKTGGFPCQSVNDYLEVILPQYDEPPVGSVWQDCRKINLEADKEENFYLRINDIFHH